MAKTSISKAVQHMVAEKLRGDKWFLENRCDIIEQNEQQLAYLIRKKMSEFVGPVVVVAVDDIKNNHPAVEVSLTVNITEVVVINRDFGQFASAIEVGEAVVSILDGVEWHFDELRHDTPGNGVLTCAVRFSGMVSRECEDSAMDECQTEQQEI